MQSIISETKNLRETSFSWKYSKFYVDFGNLETNPKIFFDLEIIAFEVVAVIGCQYVNKQSQNFRYYSNGVFGADLISEWSKNMKKILRCRFMQCFGPFNTLTVHKFSDTRLFGHLSNPFFPVYNYRNKYPPKVIFCFKVFQTLSRFRKCRKKFRKYCLILN